MSASRLSWPRSSISSCSISEIADHRRERRAQLVAHIGQELAFRAVGFLRRFLGGFQRLLGLLARGDVGMGADPFADRPRLVEDGDAAHGHVAPHAVMAAQAVLDLVEGDVGDRMIPGELRLLAVIGVDRREKAVGRRPPLASGR